jgi:hypothetical protein
VALIFCVALLGPDTTAASNSAAVATAQVIVRNVIATLSRTGVRDKPQEQESSELVNVPHNQRHLGAFRVAKVRTY